MSEPVEIELVAGPLVLRGTVQGPRDGLHVVLLHGGGQTRNSWGTVAEQLAARGCRSIAMDLRGHGRSDWAPDGDYRIDAFAADLRSVVAQLDDVPIIVGASLGGMAALIAEGETREQVSSGLVLVDIAPRVEASGVARIVEFMTSNLDGFDSLEEAADAIAAYRPDRPRPIDLDGLSKNLRQRPDGRWRWHWDPAFMSVERGAASEGTGDRLEHAARRVDVPTLLVRGKRSDLLSESGAQHFLELVPHAQFVDVAGADHMVVGDRNDAFAAAILGFVERVRARTDDAGSIVA
jgi:pimeloyl-ACP methyl ester carboxylesterase